MSVPLNRSVPAPARSAVLVLGAVVVGAGISVQLFLNGRLGESLGSFELAAAANTTTALLALIVVAVLSGTRERAVTQLRVQPVHRRWHWFIGISGAYMVLLAAFAAPRLGVALLIVALVCGQTAGGLIVDHFGASPAGRQPVTVPRIIGAALALVAVAIGALGAPVDPQPLLLGLVVLAGGVSALQQAVLGHLARSTGEPVAAGVINFVVGALVLVVVALALTGGIAPNGWSSAPPVQWLGGLFAAVMTVVIARLVPRIGVLRLMLALVAGQTIGALALDLVVPGAGGVTAATLLGVLLTLVAVGVGSIKPRLGRTVGPTVDPPADPVVADPQAAPVDSGPARPRPAFPLPVRAASTRWTPAQPFNAPITAATASRSSRSGALTLTRSATPAVRRRNSPAISAGLPDSTIASSISSGTSAAIRSHAPSRDSRCNRSPSVPQPCRSSTCRYPGVDA